MEFFAFFQKIWIFDHFFKKKISPKFHLRQHKKIFFNFDFEYQYFSKNKSAYFFFCQNRICVRFYGLFNIGHFVKKGHFWPFLTLTSRSSEQQRGLELSTLCAVVGDYGEHIWIYSFGIGCIVWEYGRWLTKIMNFLVPFMVQKWHLVFGWRRKWLIGSCVGSPSEQIRQFTQVASGVTKAEN